MKLVSCLVGAVIRRRVIKNHHWPSTWPFKASPTWITDKVSKTTKLLLKMCEIHVRKNRKMGELWGDSDEFSRLLLRRCLLSITVLGLIRVRWMSTWRYFEMLFFVWSNPFYSTRISKSLQYTTIPIDETTKLLVISLVILSEPSDYRSVFCPFHNRLQWNSLHSSVLLSCILVAK